MKKNIISIRYEIIVILLIYLLGTEIVAQERLLFNYNVLEGNASAEIRSILNNIPVQQLLHDIALNPRDDEYVKSGIKDSGCNIEQLMKTGLIRKEENVYVINFLLFTADDEYKMRRFTEEHAGRIMRGLIRRWNEIEKAAGEYNLENIEKKALLYILLGCFSLDWDGLALLRESNLIKRTTIRLPNTPPVIYAWVPTELTRKYFYKGSHNARYGNITLTSFGDHEIQPRRFLPDVIQYPQNYRDSLKQFIDEAIKGGTGNSTGELIGKIMISLREGRRSINEIEQVTGAGKSKTESIIRLLHKLGYIDSKEGKILSRIPVLSAVDSNLVKTIRSIGRQIMIEWLKNDYPVLQKDISGLTLFRYGIKQIEYFYYVWHDIFGAVNRMLVEKGLFADPYSSYYGGKGVIPTVFITALY